MKKLFLLLICIFFSNAIFAQNLNEYKYALVPAKFNFLKEKDKYQLNTLTKLFMQKYGFETYIEGEEAPYDFISNNCNKVFVDLERSSNMFMTKIKVILRDCNGKVIYTSKEGTSKEKEYRVAYNEALRGAFISFATLNHQYDESKATAKAVVALQKKEVIAEANTATNSEILYAQPIQNGFQLVNSEPKVVYKIFKTSNSDIYAAVKGNISGVFIPKGNEWFFEYYQNETLVSEKVNVKF